MEHLETGAVLDERYKILSSIGQGSMGVVYKAQHQLMGRTVAIKMLPKQFASDPLKLERFTREAKAVSALSHPNIVDIHDFGTLAGGEPFLVMDYIEGKSLFEAISDRGAFDLASSLVVFKQTASALAHAHRCGVVHRDIKTSNIMLVATTDRMLTAKLVDFGIARVYGPEEQQSQRLTGAGEIFGSPVYMSPEQLIGREVDARSDIYSLGCLMYETLSGKPPFAGATPVEIASKHLSEKPPAFIHCCPSVQVPAWLEAIIFKAMEKTPEKRQQSMEEILESLDRGIATLPAELREKIKQTATQSVSSSGKGRFKHSSTKTFLSVAIAAAIGASLFVCRAEFNSFAAYAQNRLSLFLQEQNLRPEDPALLPQMRSLAKLCRQQRRYEEAIALCLKMIPIVEHENGIDAPQVEELKLELGSLYELEGSDDKARKTYSELLKQLEVKANNQFDREVKTKVSKSFLDKELVIVKLQYKINPHAEELVESLRRVAMTYAQLGQYDPATKYYEQAYSLLSLNKNFKNRDLAWVIPSLGDLYLEQGQYKEAGALYKQAIEVFQKRFGPEHSFVMFSHATLGRYYLKMQQYDLAKAENEICSKMVEPAYIEQLRTCHIRCADGFANHREFRQAAILCNEAVLLEEKYERQARPETLVHLAGLYFSAGLTDQAITTTKKAIAIQEKHKGESDPDTQELLANLLVCRSKAGCAEAIQIYKRLLARSEQDTANNKTSTARLNYELANAFAQSGERDNAILYFKRTIDCLKEQPKDDLKTFVASLIGLGNCLTELKHWSEAETCFNQAALSANTEPAPNVDLVTIWDNQTALYINQERYEEAERLIKRALKLCQQSNFPDKQKHISVLMRYASLLSQTGRQQAASLTTNKASELKANQPASQ